MCIKYPNIQQACIILSSPILSARTRSILEMMKATCIPNYNFTVDDFRNKGNGTMAITTDAHILGDPYGHPRRKGEDAKSKS